MPVTRSAELVPVHKYATTIALVPPEDHFAGPSALGGAVADWPTSVATWAFVPTFQRGMDWKRDDVEQLIVTASEVIGTTIWGSFPFTIKPFSTEAAPAAGNPALNYEPAVALHLADGLQRLAITTTILAGLDGRNVFGGNTNPWSAAFPRLRGGLAPNDLDIARFNHHVLANYPRPALAQGYLDFFRDINALLEDQGTDPQWCNAIETFFLERRIGVDVYTGYVTSAALASNFVGINTGSQQLGWVDVFRALVVESGSSHGWTPDEALGFDADLSSTLILADRSSRLTPLARRSACSVARCEPHGFLRSRSSRVFCAQSLV